MAAQSFIVAPKFFVRKAKGSESRSFDDAEPRVVEV
jgi:hypothetical protein